MRACGIWEELFMPNLPVVTLNRLKNIFRRWVIPLRFTLKVLSDDFLCESKF